MSEEVTLRGWPIRPGVPLDPDQTAMGECAFLDCRRSSRVEPLYGIVFENRLLAVCERCYRTRLRNGTVDLMPHLSRSSLLKLLRAWLALELGAGILALVVLVAFLPLVAIALPSYLGHVIPFWAVTVDVLCISVPLAVLLGATALRVPVEVVRR